MSGEFSKANTCADVLIIGGGVIGLSIARELALRGVRDVRVIERREFGMEASWAAGGILGPQAEANCADDFFKLTCASRDLYPGFVASLTDETGIDVEFDRAGTLYLGLTADDERELRQRYEWQTRAGLHVEWLSGDDAKRLEPVISPEVRCALLFPDDWQVENRKLIAALVAANEKLGVSLITQCEVRSLRAEHGSVIGIDTSDGFINGRTVVMAAGAWTSSIGGSSNDATRAQIEPVRGQMLCFKTETAIARHVIYSSRGYVVPRHDGRVLAGSTSEKVGFDKRVTNEGLESIKSMAFAMAPVLQSAEVYGSWAGFRPHAPDDLPVLGPAGDFEGLFYATGHYRNGILLAPITAKLMADRIVDGAVSELLEVFSANRFRRAATSR